MDKWVREKGGYLVVIVDWVVQMIVSVVMVMSAGIIALYIVCCFLPHTVQKVQRQVARHRTAVSSPSAESELCMKAL